MRVWWMGLIALAGCATVQPPVVMLPPPAPPPPVIPFVVPAETRELPRIQDIDALPAIRQATAGAMIRPTRTDFEQAEVIYPYRRGVIYLIVAVPQEPVVLELQPGERLLKYTSGDKRWLKDIIDDVDPVQILLSPSRPFLKGRIYLRTTLGSYALQMQAHANTGLAYVRWRHPSKRIAEPSHRAYGIGYGVQGASGRAWEPIYAWDDGAQTYVLFGEQAAAALAPGMVVKQGEQSWLVNYAPVRSRLYRVSRLLDQGETLEIQPPGAEAVVTLARTSAAEVITCPGHEVCGLIRSWMRGLDVQE